MGARISIDLQGFLNNPKIEVIFYCQSLIDEAAVAAGEVKSPDLFQNAKVRFKGHNDCTHYFDVTSYDSKVTLEKDFNFFRNPELHTLLMRMLFENSIPFTVIPG